MKNFNTILKKEKISRIQNRREMLSLLRNLGYDLDPSISLPPEYWPEMRSICHSPDTGRFQTWFFEMSDIEESRIYPVLADLVRNRPWNLLVVTDKYDYVYFLLASATRFPMDSQKQFKGNLTVYPSVLMRRIYLPSITEGELRFISELTCTFKDDSALFRKLFHAFRNQHWFSESLSAPVEFSGDLTTSFNAEEIADRFHSYRTDFRDHRQVAYYASWQEKRESLIIPFFDKLGYSLTPGRVSQKDLNTEPDLFIYKGDSEKPGNVPVAACILADPRENPYPIETGSAAGYNVIHPDIQAVRILVTTMLQKVMVTDGRIWRVYQSDGEVIQCVDLDLFSALSLDFSRIHSPSDSFETLLSVILLPWKRTVDTSRNMTVAPASEPIQNLIKKLFATPEQQKKRASELIYGLLYILYGEMTGRILSITSGRNKIPELHKLCLTHDEYDDDQLKEYLVQHIKALDGLDMEQDIASCMFHNPHDELSGMSSLNWLNRIDSADVKKVCSGLLQTISQWCGRFENLAFVSPEQFARMAECATQQYSDDDSEILDTKISESVQARFAEATRKARTLAESKDSWKSCLRRYLSESLFRYHVVDQNVGCGVRLIHLLGVLEGLYLTALDESSDNPVQPRLPELRNLLIRDSHEHKLFLDHSTLSDTRLLRLQITQHCLYGVMNAGELRVVPSILNLAIGLSGIRFPYIGHHFHPAADSARERLSKDYSGDLPENIQNIPTNLAGMVAASRWFAEQELDLEAFGPNFTFTRAQFRMIMKRVIDFQEEHPDDQGIPLELVFPWIFHGRLTSGPSAISPGSGFDFVIK